MTISEEAASLPFQVARSRRPGTTCRAKWRNKGLVRKQRMWARDTEKRQSRQVLQWASPRGIGPFSDCLPAPGWLEQKNSGLSVRVRKGGPQGFDLQSLVCMWKMHSQVFVLFRNWPAQVGKVLSGSTVSQRSKLQTQKLGRVILLRLLKAKVWEGWEVDTEQGIYPFRLQTSPQTACSSVLYLIEFSDVDDIVNCPSKCPFTLWFVLRQPPGGWF